MKTPPIVLDKCYLQGATREEVQKLCGDYTVLMPEALFFELLTTDQKVRIACFRKFPPVENPVELITRTGIQVQLLAVLEYIRRYGIGNALEASWRIPNDVIDMEYTITGSLVGALASRDAAVQENFKLLCPAGQLAY